MSRGLPKIALTAALVAALVAVPWASASEPLDSAAQNAKLAVNNKGEALLTYTAHGRLKHVLAWGAVNAIAPTRGAKQPSFQYDYSGGYGKYHKVYWKTFGNACKPYDGPKLAWLITACKAPDGSYWALQAWQRDLPNYGVTGGSRAEPELHLSHWTGALPALSMFAYHVPGKNDKLFGSFTFNGKGVYGFSSTSRGVPGDSFGRNIYVDTFNSAYGKGWKRENSFLTHGPGGTFCYALGRHGSRPAGDGAKYRATVQGPGVTPDVEWEGAAPGVQTAAERRAVVAQIKALHDPQCS